MDAARAETYLRLLAEAELRRAASLPRPGAEPNRVWLAATTLVAAGVADPDAAWQTAAASLEVIVTGPSSRVRATVPLHWPAA